MEIDMLYPWSGQGPWTELGLPILEIDLRVTNAEAYDDADLPSKPRFRHPWRCWPGVPIRYDVDGDLIVWGSRGKTLWYVPALSADVSRRLGILKGQALKIVRNPVEASPCRELARLSHELRLQRILHQHGLGCGVDKLVLVRNRARNVVKWFEHTVDHPPNSVYLATVVEHLVPEPFPVGSVEVAENGDLRGAAIDQFRTECLKAGVVPRDLCLGNVFQVGGSLKVVDVHRWKLKFPEKEETDYSSACG